MGLYPPTYTETYPADDAAPTTLPPSSRTGLGDRLYVDGVDLSGDIGAVDTITGGPSVHDVTRLTHGATARIGGIRDGGLAFTAFYNPAAGRSHAQLSGLPTSDRVITYCRGTELGSPAAGCVAKQLGYDGKRGADGSLTFSVSAQANGYGLEWGRLHTAGELTYGPLSAAGTDDTAAAVDAGAASTFGLQAYLHVTAFTGTDATITLHESSDDGDTDPYAAITGGASTAVTAVGAQRIATSPTQTVARYLRPVVTTTGGFTALSYVLAVVRNETAVSF